MTTKYETTMTGSWFRPTNITQLLAAHPAGELDQEHEEEYFAAERQAIREQLHPNGSHVGLDVPSQGEQRVSGYTGYLPHRFLGFSKTERASMEMPPAVIQEMIDSNPALAGQLGQLSSVFSVPKIEARLIYAGSDAAFRAGRDAWDAAKAEGAKKVFVPAASPGVITIFYPNNPQVYPTHSEYLHDVAKQLHKEYAQILQTDGVTLQIDAPDLAMAKHLANWGVDFYDAVPDHVDAINEATDGLDRSRIRVHYCYGNYAGSHHNDADLERLLPDFARLKAAGIVGELANPAHEGDIDVIDEYDAEYGWPKGLKFYAGVIDVKTPIVESVRTIRFRLETLGGAIGSENVGGGTDCGFETFSGFNGVTKSVALQKIRNLALAGNDLRAEDVVAVPAG
jgi:5-methyltetrahydropteroyltriglutamate--homocysteine methyltransferase